MSSNDNAQLILILLFDDVTLSLIVISSVCHLILNDLSEVFAAVFARFGFLVHGCSNSTACVDWSNCRSSGMWLKELFRG